MKTQKHELTALLPFPPQDFGRVTETAGDAPLCQRIGRVHGGNQRQVSDRKPLPLHKLDFQTLRKGRGGCGAAALYSSALTNGATPTSAPRLATSTRRAPSDNQSSGLSECRIQRAPLWGSDSWSGHEPAEPAAEGIAPRRTSRRGVYRDIDRAQARRVAGRGRISSPSSTSRPAPRTDRGLSLPMTRSSARAVRQNEACTLSFYLDLVGAVTVMTLVVLAAILI